MRRADPVSRRRQHRDLWAFNEEVVARAIAASVIPSSAGRPRDRFYDCDFVADERAPSHRARSASCRIAMRC